MRFINAQAVAALFAVLLVSAAGGASASRQLTARKLFGTAAASDVLPEVQPLLSFTPAPITGIALAADQALGTTPAPIVLPEVPSVAPEEVPAVTRVVAAPASAADATPSAAEPLGPWACGTSEAVCTSTGTIAAVGAKQSFDVTVGPGEQRDMLVVVNSTAGDVDL